MYSFRLGGLSFSAAVFSFLVSTTWGWPMGNRHHCPDYQKRNFDTISSIYNLTVYPNQLPVFSEGSAAVPAGLFNENVVGRVDPVGTFDGIEDSIEYFFALSPIPQANAIGAAITGYKIVEFTSGCPNVASSVVWLYTSIVSPNSSENGKPLVPLKQVAFWRFDDCGAVLKYDAWIPNLNAFLTNATGVQVANSQWQQQSIQSLCGATQQLCTGNNTQWTDIGECISTLSQKPFGNYDEAWGDDIVCRTIHIVLTQVRPNVHCVHVGPTGGGKCVDTAYADEYFLDTTLYDDPLGKTFTCDEK